LGVFLRAGKCCFSNQHPKKTIGARFCRLTLDGGENILTGSTEEHGRTLSWTRAKVTGEEVN
jgi:hypothetical protein